MRVVGHDEVERMTDAELDRIDTALRPLGASGACSSEVKDAVRRFNARLERERSMLARARAAFRDPIRRRREPAPVPRAFRRTPKSARLARKVRQHRMP